MAEEQGDYKEDIHKKGSIGLGVIPKQELQKESSLGTVSGFCDCSEIVVVLFFLCGIRGNTRNI